MKLRCNKCQAQSAVGSAFCSGCGHPFGATTQGRTQVLSEESMPLSPPIPAGTTPSSRFSSPTSPFSYVQSGLPTNEVKPQQEDPQREVTVMTIDASGSMDDAYDETLTKLQAAQRAGCTQVVHKAHIDDFDEIGIAAFSSSGQAVLAPCRIGAHKPQILEAIQTLSVGGGTDINEGLKTARDMFDWSRDSVVRRIVLLTDGNGGYPIRTAMDLKKRGVVIDVIGIGPDTSDVDEKLLRKVASVIQGEVRYQFIKDQQTLVNYMGVALAEKTQTQ